ncbi:M28 family peptidase, partial [bacterium]|nr:M28 family peptidase [bacterium]
MFARVGKGVLLLIGGALILLVTVFDPAVISEKARRAFGLQTGPRADGDMANAPATGRDQADQIEDARIRQLVDDLAVADTRAVVEHLSALPVSRAVGYAGNAMAADYVEDRFRALGLHDVRSQEYEVTVPVDEGGRLHAQGKSIELFCLWPNDVRTPSLPDGFSGTLIDGGQGRFEDFNGSPMTKSVDGRDVADAVALLDFDCGQAWMNAAMLGAKAAVFFDSGESGASVVSRGQAERKMIGVPANMPRFWVSREDGLALRDGLRGRRDGVPVRMSAHMTWKTATSRNILGVIPGTLPVEESVGGIGAGRPRTIVVSAFYDAASVVPRVAPGAENACGMAALLQTVRVLRQHPPRHTVVFAATGSHFQCLWGVQAFLKRNLPTDDEYERGVVPDGKIDFDLFIGLDLTSRHPQVATTCFGTFFDRRWETASYRRNLLAPYAKTFTAYAGAIFGKSLAEAACPHINAIAPPKKTWKNFVLRPVAFDAEAVVARGKNAITLFTPHDVRERVDSPADTVDAMDMESLHTQVRTVAALVAKAGRDPEFFHESQMHMENRIADSRGNVTWFDRALNPNIPKAPIGDAVVTFRHPHAGMTAGGVRTLYTTLSQDGNPRGGDHREGYAVDNVTLNARRVTLQVWSDRIGDMESAEAVIQTHTWRVRRSLRRTQGGRVAIRVAERFVADEKGDAQIVMGAGANAKTVRGRWAAADVGRRSGVLVAGKALADGHAEIRVGNARFRGPILVPADRFEIDVDLDPPGWLERRAKQAVGGAEIEDVTDGRPETAPDIDPLTRIVRSLTLHGAKGTYEVKDIDVGFGQFEGQFVFPFVYWYNGGGTTHLQAYKLDEAGSILYAQDEGGQGKGAYSNGVEHGGGAQCVLFRCKPLTILEIVDSRYLTVLDQLGVLGPENSAPQQWGARYIAEQSREEGLTTSACVVFARHDPVLDVTQPLKIHMGTGLYGIKLLLTHADLARGDRVISRPPVDAVTDLGVTLDEARGTGYIADGGVLLHPTYRVAWDMWVLNEYRLRQLDRHGIRNRMLAQFPKQGDEATREDDSLHGRARRGLLEAQKALEARNYEKFVAETRRAWGYEAKAY